MSLAAQACMQLSFAANEQQSGGMLPCHSTACIAAEGSAGSADDQVWLRNLFEHVCTAAPLLSQAHLQTSLRKCRPARRTWALR